jgi:uncharacterized protein (DUF2164 family)
VNLFLQKIFTKERKIKKKTGGFMKQYFRLSVFLLFITLMFAQIMPVNAYALPVVVDSDGDGLSDFVEFSYGTDSTNPDSDSDGLSDGDEVHIYGTIPVQMDTDMDGLLDGDEVINGTDPLYDGPPMLDTDGDGLLDFAESFYFADINNPDSDGDGLSDGEEVHIYYTIPGWFDTDMDGLLDGEEVNTYGTDPLLNDSDGDGLSDGDEVNIYGTDPLLDDSDADGLSDGDEVNVEFTDPLLDDSDGDGLSDGEEVNVEFTDPLLDDSDGDGLYDGEEVNTYGSDPLNFDSDMDGLSDGEEVNIHGTDPTDIDTDGDGLDDFFEAILLGTDPADVDTDGDGLYDGDEVNTYGTDPLLVDTDGDGLSDYEEVNIEFTDPLLDDSDGDRLSDGEEVNTYGTDPLSFDSDGDGLLDGEEVYGFGTDPADVDTDGDRLSDGEEVNTYGTDPNDPDSDRDGLSDGAEVNTYGTLPNDPDSDVDGLFDGEEVNTYGTLPTDIDTDGDGLDDFFEAIILGTDPADVDTDGDGLDDGDELNFYRTDPLDPLDPDQTAPILTAGDTDRTSSSEAIVKFTSDESGEYYYNVGAKVTDTSIAGISCSTSEEAITLKNLESGTQDIYIVVKDVAGNISADTFKITIPDIDSDGDGFTDSEEKLAGTDPLDPDTIAPILTAGDTDRTSSSEAIVKFTSDEAGTYYYKVGSEVTATTEAGISLTTSEEAITLTNLESGTQDIYIVVKDAAGNISDDTFKITIPAYVAAHTSSGGSYDYYNIIVTQSDGGKISPNTARVREEKDKTFTISPNDGYQIKEVLVDGNSAGAVDEYTFETISKKHTITAEFEVISNEADEWINPFEDVKEDDWFYDQVKNVKKSLLMTGISDKSFGPRLKTTRGMLVTILYNMEDNPYIDTDETDWYSKGKVWAMEHNISDGTNMELNTTREQVVTILWRYQGSPVIVDYEGLTNFDDVNDISSYAEEAMAWAHQKGIIQGKPNNILDPKGYATRAEIATMVVNYLNAMEK